MAMIALLLSLKTCEEPILEVNIVFITFDEQYVFKKKSVRCGKRCALLEPKLKIKSEKRS